jgi:protein tyrosine phosphatase (PTP) superfamily phosphohydrolase (DUF442 family)
MTKRSDSRRICLLVLALLFLGSLSVGVVYGHWVVFNHRFSTVAEGRIYRSGAMLPETLVDKVRRYGIKTVIDLRRYSNKVDAERSALEQVGVRHFHIPSRQIPTNETMEAFFEVMDDHADPPILIHCKHGEGRSVLFAAIYRMEYEGWSNERARRASRFLSFLGSFSPNSRKGIFIRNYVPRRGRDNLNDPPTPPHQ